MPSSPRPFSRFLSQPLRRLGELARNLGRGGEEPQPDAPLGASAPVPAAAAAPEPVSREAITEMNTPPKAAPGESKETSWVAFLPRDPQWAQVRWLISSADREQAQRDGASQLCLRVADVTGLADGSTHPHTLQEVVVDRQASEWYLPIPLSGRDYRVELGFRKGGSGGWISLAFSPTAHVPGQDILLAPTPDPFLPFSLQPADTGIPPQPTSTGAPADLHERLYQTATSQWRRLGRGSEAFHEIEDSSAFHGGLSDSGAGPWASGRSASGIGGVSPRQRSFWLVADAELIVYGATDPSATLTIGDEAVPLSADGTFRLQVPFRDGQQLYPIEAVAADGEQKRNITLEFRRTTPEANVNSSEAAVPDWF